MSQVATDLVEIYTLRAKLHKTLYQHHTANVAELMITDVRSGSPRAPRGRPRWSRRRTAARRSPRPTSGARNRFREGGARKCLSQCFGSKAISEALFWNQQWG